MKPQLDKGKMYCWNRGVELTLFHTQGIVEELRNKTDPTFGVPQVGGMGGNVEVWKE